MKDEGISMKLNWINVVGFRNFVDETINLSMKTLIIGANDVGKSNLLYALRLIFDRSISDKDLELTDSDYNVYSRSKAISITVQLVDITEDCLKSVFVDAIKDGTTYIRYTNSIEGNYSFWVGCSLELLQERTSRIYTKRLHMECVDTNRDLLSFLKREKGKLLLSAKSQLDEVYKEKDRKVISQVQKELDKINKSISNLNYIKNSLLSVNSKLSKLSLHNEDQEVKFVAGNSDAQKLLDNLELSYTTGDSPLCVGGDGRNNQIFIATWLAKQEILKSSDHVTFYAIEEPEAHLHPHQQRKLSQYLFESFDEQVLITTHSPQIASTFTPANIVRLFTTNKVSKVAQGGCSSKIRLSFEDFGYRLNAISSEAFFTDGILLVEGTSEKLFYTVLASELHIDLDRLNISIIPVDGVGFKPYVKICKALEIPYTLRTDNDVFIKTIKKEEYSYFAGLSRSMGIYDTLLSSGMSDPLTALWEKSKKKNEWKHPGDPPTEAIEIHAAIKQKLESSNIFISLNDLENDLANSPLSNSLSTFYKERDIPSLVHNMQTRKAENMLYYLQNNAHDLKVLNKDDIALPLKRLVAIIEEAVHPNGGDM